MSDFTIKMTALFTQKNWINDVPDDAFQNAISLALLLTGEEREVFYQLFTNYLIVSSSKYESLLKRCVSKLNTVLLQSDYKIFIMPLLKECDKDKNTKSSVFLTYFFKAMTICKNKVFDNKKLIFDKKGDIEHCNWNTDNARLILVDDFIGSGKTASTCIDEYKAKGVKVEKIIVLALVTMLNGKKIVEQKGVKVVYDTEIKKGISEMYKEPQKSSYLSIIDTIETKYKVSDMYKRGLGKCEGLITLMRTPNNTFPIFWGNEFKTPPFPRSLS
jgi:hypothetical protein